MVENLDQNFKKKLEDHSWTLGPGLDDSLGEAARRALTEEGYVNDTTRRFLGDQGGEPITRLKADTPRKKRTALLLRTTEVIKSDRKSGTREDK